MFVHGEKIRYADPRPGLVGVPIIDLACFAGVSLCAYALPGAEEGYAILKAMACEFVADLLHLPRNQAERLFAFGRALQSAHSARFRVEKNPDLAREFAKESIRFLDAFLKPGE